MKQFKRVKVPILFSIGVLAITGIVVGAFLLFLPAKQNPPAQSITLVTSRWSGPHADYQRKLFDLYEKETGVKVIQDAVDYGQLKTKQTMNMINKTGEYDLVWVQESWLKEYVEAGYLLPLNQYFKTVRGFSIEDYIDGLVQYNTFDDAIFGIPTMLQTAIVAFDRRALEKAQLAPPETWDEILTVARYFKENGPGIAMPVRKGRFDDNIWEALMYSGDGAYLDSNGFPALDSPQNIAALGFYQKLMKYAMKGSLNWHVDEANQQLQFANTPIAITISGLAGILEDPSRSKIAGHVVYRPLPYKIHPAGTISFWNWCIPADSKHPEAAFKFIAWLTSARIEKMQSLENGQLSAINSLFNDPELQKKLPYLSAILPYIKKPYTSLTHPQADYIVSEMMEVLFRVSVSDVDPAEALRQLQQKVTTTLSLPSKETNP